MPPRSPKRAPILSLPAPPYSAAPTMRKPSGRCGRRSKSDAPLPEEAADSFILIVVIVVIVDGFHASDFTGRGIAGVGPGFHGHDQWPRFHLGTRIEDHDGLSGG